MSMPTRLLLIAAVLGLSACTTLPQSTAMPSFEPVLPTNTFKVALGSIIDVPQVKSSDPGEARVLAEYHSASGRHCLKVEMQTPLKPDRVMCQRDNGEWSFTRSLFTSQIAPVTKEPLVKSSTNEAIAKVESEPAPVPVRVRVKDVPSGVELFGATFEAAHLNLASFDVQSVWNFAGTYSAGPANWADVVAASGEAMSEVEEFITGSR
ncbi:MAG: hypothetical protein AB8B84_13210 [Granulosicoccus sp.]